MFDLKLVLFFKTLNRFSPDFCTFFQHPKGKPPTKGKKEILQGNKDTLGFYAKIMAASTVDIVNFKTSQVLTVQLPYGVFFVPLGNIRSCLYITFVQFNGMVYCCKYSVFKATHDS